MEMRVGNQRIYGNFALGAAKHPTDDESMYLVFTDKDNEVVHMFDIALDKLDEYIELLRKTKHTHQLHVASADEMPPVGGHGRGGNSE